MSKDMTKPLPQRIYTLYEKGKRMKIQPLAQLIGYLVNHKMLNVENEKYWREHDNGWNITYTLNIYKIMEDLDKIKIGDWELK